MTKKELILSALKDADKVHKELVHCVKLLKNGISFHLGDTKGKEASRCAFDEWLTEYKPILIRLHTVDSRQFAELEKRHREIHRLFDTLQKATRDAPKRPMVLKLFQSKKADTKLIDTASRIYLRISEAEEAFSESIRLLAKRIGAVPEKEIAALFNGER